MSTIKTLTLTLFFFISTFVFAQTGKYTDKLADLYNQKEFEKMIAFKTSKEDKMASKSLFYKGMAYYFSDQDTKSIEYFTKAINKGPADYNMYYFRGMARYYSGDYRTSLTDFDQAIALSSEFSDFYSGKAYSFYKLEEMDSALTYFMKATRIDDCSASIFASAANLNQENKAYATAVSLYKKAISMVEVKSKDHQRYNYNLGLTLQLKGDYFDAQTIFRDHAKLYPDDYQALAKLIQLKYAMGESTATESLKDKLYDAAKNNELPSYLSKMYCFVQFNHLNYEVLGYESYTFSEEEILEWKHKFYVDDEDGETVCTVLTVLDSNTNEDAYHLNLIKNDTLYTYTDFEYKLGSDFDTYKAEVLKVIDGKVEANSTMGGYEAWYRKNLEKMVESLGATASTAIIVSSVPEEYEWLRKYYPGYEFIMQALVSEGENYYDILKFKTADGEVKSIYFNITSFFGKW